MSDNIIKLAELLKKLPQAEYPGYVEAYRDSKMEAGIYKPDKVDYQEPHDEDELYVVLSGHGNFRLEGELTSVAVGDLLYVPAKAEHRFEDFSDDFVVWAFFY